MSKNKLIALGIIVVLFTFPFHYGYLAIKGNGGIFQAMCMVTIIVGSIIAILLFNKKSSEEAH